MQRCMNSAPVSSLWHLLSPSSRWNRGQASALCHTNNSSSKPYTKKLFTESNFGYIISYIKKKENVYTRTHTAILALVQECFRQLTTTDRN